MPPGPPVLRWRPPEVDTTTSEKVRAARKPFPCPERWPSGLPACRYGPHVHALVKPEIHIVDVRHAVAQRRGDVRIRLQAFEKAVLAEVQQGRVTLEQHDRVVHVADVDLGDPLREVLARRFRRGRPC